MSSIYNRLRFSSLASTVSARTARDTRAQRDGEALRLVVATAMAGLLVVGSIHLSALAQLLAFCLAVALLTAAVPPPIIWLRRWSKVAGRLCQWLGMDDTPMARIRRSGFAEGRAKAARQRAAAQRLHLAFDLERRMAARLLALVGAITLSSQPRLATAMVAGAAASPRS